MPSNRLQKGDRLFIEVTVHDVYTEPGIVPNDRFYSVILPQVLEYRFPQGSMPMAIVQVKQLKRQK